VLRRGFKTLAEQIAIELRAELELGVSDRLDCRRLASHLCIPVSPVTALLDWGVSISDLDLVTGTGGCLSAMTQFRGTRCSIFYNPQHSAGRTANSIAHELAHVILEHTPGPAIGSDGSREFDPRQEAEADWQAGALLVPRPGALWWLERGGDFTGGADHFGVSAELFSWRAHQTGVVRQLAHRRGGV
jgi:Zn-dependent peptidase ImmA (M78 family)